MPSSSSFPSSAESEAADALLRLWKPQPSVWGSTKKRSIRYKSKSDSKITARDDAEIKIVPKILSPSSPLCFDCIPDDPQPPQSEVSPSEVLSSELPPPEAKQSEVSPRSTSPKRHGEILKERKEKVAVLVQENLTLQKTHFEMKTRYLMLKEHNAWLKWMKEGLALNRQYWGKIPIESVGNVAAMEEMRRKMLLMAEERRRRWKEVCAAARRRRRRLMKVKAGVRDGMIDESEGRREGCAIAREARKRRMEMMRSKVEKKRQRLG